MNNPIKYDVFISCKSEDYHYAVPIYHFLTTNGLKVFLADVELRAKGRDVYGEIIDAALESAEHLIVFASKAEYVESTYVKSEWRTFVEEKRSGRKEGNIITILKGVQIANLPIALRSFQSFKYAEYKDSLAYLQVGRVKPEPIVIGNEDRFNKNAIVCKCMAVWTTAWHSDFVQFSPDGQNVIFSPDIGALEVRNIQTKSTVWRCMLAHTNNINSVSYSPDGRLCVSASNDNTIKIWQVGANEYSRLSYFRGGFMSWPESATFSPEYDIIAGLENGLIRKCEYMGRKRKTFRGHKFLVFTVMYSPSGKLIVSASLDKTIRIWDASTGECVKVLKGHNSSVNSAVFSSDGRYIVSASDDKTIRIWNASTGECVKIFEGHDGCVQSAVYSPDGRYIASASKDKTIRIWNASTGECIKVLEGHNGGVTSAVFSPDGRYIASSSYDHTIRIWEFLTTVEEDIEE